MKFLKIFLGVTGAAIGLLGYLLIGYVLVNWKNPDPWVYVLAACFGLLFAGFLAGGVKGIRNGLNYSPPVYSANQPWLNTEAWKNRRIVHGSSFHGFALVLAYVFFGPASILLLLPPPASAQLTPGAHAKGVVMGVAVIATLVVLTYMWLRHARYGDSVCRLLTLPGVVGGWFKADIECKLPRHPDGPVIVRLKNSVPKGRGLEELWRMEESVMVPIVARHSIVPVRLRIPRHPSQRAMRPEAAVGERPGPLDVWTLEIEKQAHGVDFLATFVVPVYDTVNAPASEQRSER